jgi:DNA polymerase-3 subunit delta'
VADGSVVGHDRVQAVLARAIQAGRLPPALLLTGPEGVGKRTVALSAARALVCEAARGVACEACPACRRAARGLHPDVLLVEPETSAMKTSAIKIEQVRDMAREVLALPFEGRARGFVVDDAHVMTEQAGNALLKSLEEPPATSHVFLVTASPQALLPTIRSRCQTLRLGPLPPALLESFLRDRAGLTAEEARLRAAISGGSIGAALALDSDAYRASRNELLSVLERAGTIGAVERMEAAQRLADLEDPALVLTTLRSLLRDALVLRSGGGTGSLLNADVEERLLALARGPLGERAAALAEAAGETREALRLNANRLLSMDVLMDGLAG